MHLAGGGRPRLLTLGVPAVQLQPPMMRGGTSTSPLSRNAGSAGGALPPPVSPGHSSGGGGSGGFGGGGGGGGGTVSAVRRKAILLEQQALVFRLEQELGAAQRELQALNKASYDAESTVTI